MSKIVLSPGFKYMSTILGFYCRYMIEWNISDLLSFHRSTRIHGTMCHTPQRPKQSLRLYPIKYCDPASSQIYLASQAFFLNIIEENYNMDPSLTLYPKNILSDAGAACNMP